jgi:hypothetical protein
VNITVVPDEDQGDGAPFGAVLPGTAFSFYGPSLQPRRGGNLGEIRLIPVSSIQQREFEGGRLEALRTLLEELPPLDPTSDDPPTDLPVLPDVGAAQLVIGKAGYASSDTMAGVVFLAGFGQDIFPFSSDSFWFLFQGLSTDGTTWVSVAIPLTTDLFPETVSDELLAQVATPRGWRRYQSQARATLAEAPPEAFTPSLTAVGELVGSMAFVTPEPAAP